MVEVQKPQKFDRDQQEVKVCDFVNQRFLAAKAKKNAEAQLWMKCMDAYYGYLQAKKVTPSYRSNHTSNYIFKTIETIRPIMIDNDPNFEAVPRTKEGVKKAEDIALALKYEFDREDMQRKMASQLIMTLVTGNALYYVPWDGKDGTAGNLKYIPIDPMNFFPDPLATNMDDAEYVIYATYKNVNVLKRLFPNKANKIEGASVKYGELVNNRSDNAGRVTNQVLVLEMWTKDYSSVEVEEEINGETQKVKKRKYPNGRVITVAPELSLVFSDKANPYRDGKFPFVLCKDYDVPFLFWGKGDVEQLISPQEYMDDLRNQIIDNARQTGNMPWIVDNNAGIGKGKLTNRPGLIIRKNPGTDVRREQPPSMPAYIQEQVIQFQNDMEAISGVHEAASGERPVGIQAGNAIVALQEAGQSRIRLKVKLMEWDYGRLATLGLSRIRQFWTVNRFVRATDSEGKINFKEITTDDLLNDYDIKVKAGSTMPKNKGAMLDLMIRLGQTMAEDGLPVVGREEILRFVELPDKQKILKKYERLSQMQGNPEIQAMQEEQAQFMEQMAQQAEQTKAEQKEVISIVQELSQAVKQISAEIQKLSAEHQKVMQKNDETMQERALLDAERKGMEKGMAEAQKVAPENAMDDANFAEQIKNGILPTEVLDEISQLDDTQLLELLAQNPELEKMLKNQPKGSQPKM